MSELQQLSSPEQWVDEHGDVLYRFALSRLSNPSTAEDVVQETFLAALKARDTFSGRSPERTWLIGILKHKIVDLIRKESRELPSEKIEALQSESDLLFDKTGHWRTGPLDWQVHPQKVLEQKEFQAVLRECIEKLPERLRASFVLREMDGEDTEKICKVLGVTPTNLWVVLYRARTRLQGCLSKNWFGESKREQT